MNQLALSAFDKARSGLWISLQTHLVTVYNFERAFIKSVAFADSFPFSIEAVDADLLHEYQTQRKALRDLYTDETVQLDALVKAVRTKGYEEDEKKQLYLLILGYTDILATVAQLLDTHRPSAVFEDEEFEETRQRFDRLQKLIRLLIKGISGLLTGNAV